ncbi:MAG: hypothetical protein U1E89_20870 [Burkholderiaceae bacterium]
MARDYHVFEWHDERPDDRPSELMRSTGYGGLFPNSQYGPASTQHGDLYDSRIGTFQPSQQPQDSGFTRPSRLPRERVAPRRRRWTEVPTGVVLATIFGGAAFLIWEFARQLGR